MNAVYAERDALAFMVIGTPIPQGSQRAFNRKGGGQPIVTSDNPRTRPWKDAVAWNAKQHLGARFDGPVTVHLWFWLMRPTGHYNTKGTAVRPSAPRRPTVKPDLDKLCRAVLDALTEAGVWRDDAQVVGITTGKAYVDDIGPGVSIEVWPA